MIDCALSREHRVRRFVHVLVSLTRAGDAYPTLGASTGVFGVLVAYPMSFPQRRVMLLFPPIAMPAWLFATACTPLELMLGIGGTEPGVAHCVRLGGMVGALILVLRCSREIRARSLN